MREAARSSFYIFNHTLIENNNINVEIALMSLKSAQNFSSSNCNCLVHKFFC